MILSIKNNPKSYLKILIILGVIFFFIYSFLNFGNSLSRFTWPDETANNFFISNFIENSSIRSAEPLNEIGGNLVKPRSFNVYDNNLVPGSFLGLILIYGLIGKIIGVWLVKFLTPLLAVIGVIFFYKLLLKVFQPNIAFLSALFLFINPAWWYYANLIMLPNIAFLCFVIVGIYYLLETKKDKLFNWQLILGSSFIALALIIRTNEFLWIFGVLALLLLVYHKKIKWQQVLIFIIINIIVFLPILYLNYQTYGSALSFGYLRLDSGAGLSDQLPTEFKTQGKSSVYNMIKFIILPFGFSPGSFVSNFYNYFIYLFWWIFIPMIIGLLSLIKNFHKQAKGVYMLIFLAVSGFLVIYYGSWVFADMMTLQLNRIGISYVRYFLPMYILAMPFVAIFYIHLIDLFKSNKFKTALISFLVLMNLFFTINILYVDGHDNLSALKNTINYYNQIHEQVIQATEENAVIISQRSDKIFFPQRKVISRWEPDDMRYFQSLINNQIPLYYYAFEGQSYLEEFAGDLINYDLELIEKNVINEQETFYEIKLFLYE